MQRRIVILGLALLAALASRPGIARAGAQIWPVSGGGGMRLGYTPLHFPPTHYVPWSVDLAGTCIGDSSPAVDEFHRTYIATNDDRPRLLQSFLYCIGSDGNLVWKVPIGARLEFQPILLSTGTIVVISDIKELYAFNPDGTLFWKQQLTAAPAPQNGDVNAGYSVNQRQPAHIQPVPDAGGGFFAVDDSPAVISFDAKGARRWTAGFINTPLGGLTMGENTLYLPTSDAWLHIFSSANGAEFNRVSINGTAPFYGTYMPGSLLYYPVLATNGPQALALSIANIRPFDLPLSLSPAAPVTIDAAGEAVVTIGAAGSQDKTVMTDGQVLGLDKTGNVIWSRDFSALPMGTVLADAGGLLCFGTHDVGQSGVYCFDPRRGIIWWALTQGATSVFPIDDYLLGEVVFYKPEFNKTTLMTVGRQ